MCVDVEMPKGTVDVWYLKIAEIRQVPADKEKVFPDGDWELVFEKSDVYAPIIVGHTEYIQRFHPEVGGYYAVAKVGHIFYLPPNAVIEKHNNEAKLYSVEARYKDLLNHLGVLGHDGALAEIRALRRTARLDILSDVRPTIHKTQMVEEQGILSSITDWFRRKQK